MTRSRFPQLFAYERFARSVRYKRRYLLTQEAGVFLRYARETAQRRVSAVQSGTLLWRAQGGASKIERPIDGIDETYEVDYPFDTSRMKPPVDRAREGRANPKGIPFLYLATDRDTAASEVRPWKGGVVSIGQFRVTRDLRLVNTTIRSKYGEFLEVPKKASAREETVWGDIDHAFSEPTSRSDDAAEYAPTQVLAELFREAGFDGVAYRSAYGRGHNVVLFNISLAEQVNGLLLRVRDSKFTFELDEQSGYDV
jgi:RES domain-containing protein